MAKLILNASIALIALAAVCSASPARLERLRPSKSKFLARQEAAEEIPSQTPYPPAGIKPEIRFDLPTDEKLIAPDNTYLPPVGAPVQTYGPPAKTYGPPEVSVKDEVEEVSNDEPKEDPQSEEPQAENPQPEEQPKSVEPEEEEQSTDQPEEAEAPQLSDDEQDEDNNVENDSETEAEQIEAEIERVEAEEGLINPFPERIVLARSNAKKGANLRSAKLQAAQPIYLINYNGQLYRLLK